MSKDVKEINHDGIPSSAVNTSRGPQWLSQWALIALTTWAASAGIAGLIARAWDPCMWFGFVVLSAPLVLLGFSWIRHLRSLHRQGTLKVDKFQFSVRSLLGITTILGVSLAMTTCLIRNEVPQVGEHVETETPPFGIPVGAKDICWHQYSRGTVFYEFSVDEATFRQWAEAELCSVFRPGVKIEPAAAFEIDTYKVRVPLTDPDGRVTVTNGLVYDWNEEDAGIHAVWDRASNRVYFCVY